MMYTRGQSNDCSWQQRATLNTQILRRIWGRKLPFPVPCVSYTLYTVYDYVRVSEEKKRMEIFQYDEEKAGQVVSS